MKISPRNLGITLRRTLDYSLPNQRAEVFLADASGNSRSDEPFEWKPAGVWHLAGSNRCVYSNPKDELGATEHVIETSDRRFRDDEFLISGRDLELLQAVVPEYAEIRAQLRDRAPIRTVKPARSSTTDRDEITGEQDSKVL